MSNHLHHFQHLARMVGAIAWLRSIGCAGQDTLSAVQPQIKPQISARIPFFSLREAQLEKAVTSIALSGGGQQFFVGTEAAQMYGFSCKDFTPELISSSHRSAVKDVAICL